MYDERSAPHAATPAPRRTRDLPERARVRELHPADGGRLRTAVRRSQLRPGPAAVCRGAGTPADRVPLVAGVLFSIAAGAGAVGHHFCGRLLRRASARRVIAASAGVGAVGAVAYVLARGPWLLVRGHADLRPRDRRRDDGGLHGGEQRDAGRRRGRRFRSADDRVARPASRSARS